MQVDTNCYWNQHPKNQIITVPKCTIINPQLEVNIVTDINETTKSVCNRKQERKPYQDILYGLPILTNLTS